MLNNVDRKAKGKLCTKLLLSTALGGIAQLGLMSAAAKAQTGAPATSAPEEVVVTAERRSETVQNVPMSITAISSATIEKFDIQDFSDYAKDTPNLSFGMGMGGGGGAFGQGLQSLGFSIRGISGYDTTAFYIDDTPLPDSLDPRVLDIDHIEVLRGPQGSLFGASSMGGLVRIITQQAALNKFDATVTGQAYDMSHGGAPGGEVTGVLNVPLVQDLASMRLSVFDSYTPGFFQRTYNDPLALDVTGQKVTGPAQYVNNVGASPSEGLALTFKVDPAPGLVLTPQFRWQETLNDGFPLADYDTNNLVQRRILNEPESSDDTWYFAAFTGAYTVPFGRFVSSTSYLNRSFHDLEDGSDANSAFLYGPPTPMVLASPSIGDGHTQTFTEEDRFESSFDFPVQIVAGVFYQRQQERYINTVTMPGASVYPSILGPGTIGTDLIWNLMPSVNDVTQTAAFLGITWTPIQAVEIQVGGRETHQTNYSYSFSDGYFGTGAGEWYATDNAFTPRFSAKYKFDPNNMVYVTAAQGFRIGGANVPLGSACGGFGFSTTAEIPYAPDTLWSYEGGIKSSFLANKVTVDADVYHIDWSKIQQTETLSNGANGCFAGLTLNLGDAQSDGAEFEATTRIVDNLSLHTAIGYEDARLTKVVPGTEYTVGEPLSGVPMWTGSVSADYTIPQPWGAYFIRGQYSFTGQSMSYTELATGLPRKAYELTDVRVGANYHLYTMTLFVKNLFDSRPNLSDEVPVSALAGDRYRYDVGLPREIGVELRYHMD